MQLIVNGTKRHLPDGSTIKELLAAEEEPVGHVIVEVNGVFVPNHQYESRVLGQDDRVEIILPAFGG